MAHTFTRFYVENAGTINRAEFIERLRAPTSSETGVQTYVVSCTTRSLK